MPEELSVMEDHWIRELNTLWPGGYNMRDGTNFVCDQTRKLISERTREAMMNVDPSYKVRQREAMNDPETRRLISERTKQAMRRPEVIAKIAAVRDETRLKISETLKGHEVTEETKKLISERTKAAMSDLDGSHLEKLRSRMKDPEVRKKMSDAGKKREARKRNNQSGNT
jgi:hypothetical protein